MESITKNRQTPETLRAMIARAYGDTQVPSGDGWFSELGEGWFNVAYRIRLRDGSQKVLKIAPPSDVEVMTYERGAMSIELAAIKLIQERSSVPVPAVDYADQSHDLCDADWFFMEYIDAINFGVDRDSMSAEERETYGKALGAANRELNEIRGAAFGPLAGPGDPSWRAVFTGILEDVLGDGERRQVDLGIGYDTVRASIAANAHHLDEVTEPRFVGWDLWDKNVMVRDGAIAAILDHERALYGDHLMEAGFVGHVLPDFGNPTTFMQGYGQTDLTPGQLQRRRLYALHLVLIMVIEGTYRGFTDPDHLAWTRTQLTEILAQL
ncbi:phosphotransferase family protein [Actinoplanes sp. GCM10030250]|uniref:phosphotransferase family protein n=1 Tax=Actinoplanes sp. GCM10030250 TaxID=3273376 RepID=UPI003613994D